MFKTKPKISDIFIGIVILIMLFFLVKGLITGDGTNLDIRGCSKKVNKTEAVSDSSVISNIKPDSVIVK